MFSSISGLYTRNFCVVLSIVFGTRCYFIFYGYSLSSIFVLLLWANILWMCGMENKYPKFFGILIQVTAKKADKTPLYAIAHQINCNGSLLFPFYHHLNIAQVHNNAHWHHSIANIMCLTEAVQRELGGATNFNDGGRVMGAHGQKFGKCAA